MKNKIELEGETLERFVGLLGQRNMAMPSENVTPNDLVESLLDFWDRHKGVVKKAQR